jgi:hypothetical protein
MSGTGAGWPDAPCLLPDLFGVFTARGPDFAVRTYAQTVKLAYKRAEYPDTSLESKRVAGQMGDDFNRLAAAKSRPWS